MKPNYITTIGEQYKLIKELSKGRWSQTFLAEDFKTPEQSKCIVKQIQNSFQNPEDLLEIESFWNQQTTFWQTKIVNSQIVPFLACFQENNHFCLIQKYIEGETLATTLQTSDRFTEIEAINRLREILAIITPLHQQGIVHGNLKPANFVIDQANNQLILIDFGIINNLRKSLISKNDSVKFPREENNYYPLDLVAKNKQQTVQADYYAVGIMILQMLANIYPAKLPVNPSAEVIFTHVNRQIHPQLLQIIERMTDLNSAKSYTSGTEIIADINQIDSQVKNTQPEQGNSGNSIQKTSIVGSKLQTQVTKIKQKPQYFLAVLFGILALGGIGEVLFPTVRPAYYVWQGQRQLATEPKEALTQFQKATKIQPQSASGWKNRGNALFRLERYRAALVAYDKGIQISPKNAKMWQGRGEALYRLERFEAAVTAYDKALQLQPKNVTILNRKGRALYKLERYTDALAAQDQALRLKPDDVNAMKDRGIALLGMGKHEEAIVAFSNAQTFAPLNPELWQNKALALQYINQPQQAMRLYQEAVEAYENQIQANPKNITAMLDKANVLGKLQQHEQALMSYEQALEVNPDSHLAWLGKGNTLFVLRKYDQALAAFDRASKLQPKSYLTWHNRGSLLRDGLRKYSEAIASYDRSIAINPNFYHAWRDRGIALSKNSQHEEAIQSFKKALDIKPNDYKSWVSRGIALSSLNRNEEAIYSFDRAAEINPNDPFVLMNRATALEKNQRYSEACDVYLQLTKMNPGFSPAIQARKKLNCS